LQGILVSQPFLHFVYASFKALLLILLLRLTLPLLPIVFFFSTLGLNFLLFQL